MANPFLRLGQKINFMRSRWICENCQKSVGVRHFDACFNEEGDFVCPFCRHQVMQRARDENRSYNFNLDHIKSVDSVQLQREEAISIIEKKWQASSGFIFHFFSAVLFLGLVSWGFVQPTPFSADSLVLLTAVLGGFLFCFFKSLQFILNTSRIMMKKDRLVVAQMPLSFSSLVVIPFHEIDIFSFWRKASGKAPLQFSFRFDVFTKSGKTYFLAPCRSLSEALYLEKTLLELMLIERTELPPVDEYLQ